MRRLRSNRVHRVAERRRAELVTPDATRIVPRIRDGSDVERLAARARAEGEPLLPPEPLVSSLVVVYCFDRPGMYQMLMERDLEAMGLAAAALRPLAVENALRIARGFEAAVGPVIEIGHPLATATMLLPAFWDRLEDEVGSQLVVGVPRPDVVIACPIDDLETVELYAAILARERVLCEDLLVRDGDGWMRLEDLDDDG